MMQELQLVDQLEVKCWVRAGYFNGAGATTG